MRLFSTVLSCLDSRLVLQSSWDPGSWRGRRRLCPAGWWWPWRSWIWWGWRWGWARTGWRTAGQVKLWRILSLSWWRRSRRRCRRRWRGVQQWWVQPSVAGRDSRADRKWRRDWWRDIPGKYISEYHHAAGAGAGLTVMGHERRAKEIQRRWRANTDLYFFLSMLTMLVLQRPLR